MSDHPVWASCLDYFQRSLPPQQFETWIKPLIFNISGSHIVLTAPNSFALKLIQDRFLPVISQQAESLLSFAPSIEFRIEKKSGAILSQPIAALTSSSDASFNGEERSAKHHKESGTLKASLNFDHFVTGKANQLAHAAAIQVSDTPGNVYNPLFIYGGVGLGKTHLLQAIGNQIKANSPKAKVCYIHATDYVSSWVRAVQTKRFDEFKQFFNSLDLLLIDDIQFIADKAGTQQEFFYTLNTLTEAHKQVVITCDTFPKDINGIEARLISRFSWGLTVAVDPPNFEMRAAILLNKAIQAKIPLGEDVAFFIAKHVRSNVRELEGALKRIDAFSRFHKRPISVEVAKEALKDLLASQNKQVSIENIQKTVADFYRIKVSDLLSKKRTRNITRPRQMAMLLARELTQFSLPEIGAAFGDRDHSTVLYACRTIEVLKRANTTTNSEYATLSQSLRN